MGTVITISILLLPLFIYSFDYIIKTGYILYWDMTYNQRFDNLYYFMRHYPSKVYKRRDIVKGKYVIGFVDNNISTRPCEFVVDTERKLLYVHGTREKYTSTIFGKNFISPPVMKISDDFMNMIKSKFKGSLSDKEIKHIDDIMTKVKENVFQDGELKIRVDTISVYKERTINEEKIKDIITQREFVLLCVDKYRSRKSILSKEEINKILTTKIYDSVYKSEIEVLPDWNHKKEKWTTWRDSVKIVRF